MTSVAYFNAGSSIYDGFFLTRLHEKFNVFLLTFNPEPKFLPKGIDNITIPEFIKQLPAHDGPRTYSMMPLKAQILKKTLKDLRPDVLIGCNGLKYGLCSALSNYKPFVLFIWGSEVLLAPSFLPYRALVKYSLKKADYVVVDSRIQLRACVKLGCDLRKIIRFPWFDFTEFENLVKSVKVDKGEFRKKFGWSENDSIIICTRWHASIYNVDCIIKAIPMVLDRVKNARFLFLGEGTLTEKLKQLVRDLNVEKNAYFTGFIPHEKTPYYLKNSDMYVSSSLSDGTSASLLEAMTCKLSCIVSDILGNKEWIKNKENGLVFPTKNSSVLAKKIITLIENEDLSARLAQAAFRTVHERANWKENSKVLDDLIERLAEKRVTRSKQLF